MVSSLETFTIPRPTEYMLTAKYKLFIESMIPQLIAIDNPRTLPITPSQGSIDKGDLTGFLLDNNIPYEEHYLVMRMNGLSSVRDLDETILMLILPDPNLLAAANGIYESSLL